MRETKFDIEKQKIAERLLILETQVCRLIEVVQEDRRETNSLKTLITGDGDRIEGVAPRLRINEDFIRDVKKIMWFIVTTLVGILIKIGIDTFHIKK